MTTYWICTNGHEPVTVTDGRDEKGKPYRRWCPACQCTEGEVEAEPRLPSTPPTANGHALELHEPKARAEHERARRARHG